MPAGTLEKDRPVQEFYWRKKVMSRQMHKIRQEIADNKRVALEVEWAATLAVPFGSIPVGGQMKAFFAVFLEFREGKIVRQRNYDCFEAW